MEAEILLYPCVVLWHSLDKNTYCVAAVNGDTYVGINKLKYELVPVPGQLYWFNVEFFSNERHIDGVRITELKIAATEDIHEDDRAALQKLYADFVEANEKKLQQRHAVVEARQVKYALEMPDVTPLRKRW